MGAAFHLFRWKKRNEDIKKFKTKNWVFTFRTLFL